MSNPPNETAPERITPERLYDHADNISPGGHVYPSDVLRAAADEMRRLFAENAALRADSARIVGQAVQGMNKVALSAYEEGRKNG